MAHHVVVHALEGRSGITPLRRLWLALGHAGDGQLSYRRCHEAGLMRAKERASSGEIEGSVKEWLATDLNPSAQTVRLMPSLGALVAGYNAYNSRSCMGVQTKAEASSGGDVVTSRRLVGTSVDPEPCRIASLVALRTLVDELRNRSRRRAGADALAVSDVARRLGVESSATAQAAKVFEARGAISIPELARELGCGQRTLERTLKDEGGSAEAIRMSTRIVTANHLLASDLSLTQIAFDAGFSDAAHMTRSFKAACGMPPSMLRQFIRPEPTSDSSRSSGAM